MTWASPSARPAYFAGSSRASIQVRIAKRRAGGNASLLLSTKSPAYFSFAETTSLNTVLCVVMVDILRLQTHDQGEMKSAHSRPVKIIDFRSLRQRETNFAGNRRASGVKTFQLPKWGANLDQFARSGRRLSTPR